jgi:hypothetical protein
MSLAAGTAIGPGGGSLRALGEQVDGKQQVVVRKGQCLRVLQAPAQKLRLRIARR